MIKYDIAIIGGGAAGIISAIFASRAGKKTIIIERNDSIGKKLLATGNGRCNITNINADFTHYRGGSRSFIKDVLRKFSANDTMIFFESLGLLLKEEDNGRIFPRSDRADSVLDALINELEKNSVRVLLNSLVRRVSRNNGYVIYLDDGKMIEAKKLIITTGGKASHQFGSSGDGYFWAEKFGHTIAPLFPSLVPVEIKEDWIKTLQGIKITGKICARINEKILEQIYGDILFTHYGISGPAAMAAGRIISSNPHLQIFLNIDLFPDIEIDKLQSKLNSTIEQNGKKTIKNCLFGFVPQALAIEIIKNIKFNPEKKSAEISKKDRNRICMALKNIELTPTGTRSFKEAQVTSGGINVDEIDSDTMESKKSPGLYFAGEIIDVDGESGGYNLQWAWSSGFIAGSSFFEIIT